MTTKTRVKFIAFSLILLDGLVKAKKFYWLFFRVLWFIIVLLKSETFTTNKTVLFCLKVDSVKRADNSGQKYSKIFRSLLNHWQLFITYISLTMLVSSREKSNCEFLESRKETQEVFLRNNHFPDYMLLCQNFRNIYISLVKLQSLHKNDRRKVK